MDTQGERLSALISTLEIQSQQIAQDMGVSKQVVSDWEGNRTAIRKPNCLALQALYGVAWQWLMEGSGPMWVDPADRQSADLKSFLLDRPMIEGATSCGPGGEIRDPGPTAMRYAIRRDFAANILRESGGGREEDLFFLRCKGDSMRPTILPDEIVLLNTAESVRMNPRNHGIYLVRRNPQDPETRVKRAVLDTVKGQLLLSSDNRAYGPLGLDLEGLQLHQVILGRVCWLGRYLINTDPQDSDW